VVGAVVFEGATGPEGRLVSTGDTSLSFGRGGRCDMRFAFAPRVDRAVPRIAGSLLLAGGRRLAVECSAERGHRPLQVMTAGGVPVTVALGEVYAPAANEFDVVVSGDTKWVVSVRVRDLNGPYPIPDRSTDTRTRRIALDLSDHDRSLIEAYLEPMRAGGPEPASHADVAARLAYSPSKVRHDLYDIWARMAAAGFPIQDGTDKRSAVLDIVQSYRIV
jgi:hypothetical protein